MMISRCFIGSVIKVLRVENLLKRSGVISFTFLSVHWAERMTAKSSVQGLLGS